MKIKRFTLSAAIAASVVAIAAAGQSAQPRRIVSLIPAVTEMIFAIGEGRRLVGVSSYDRFPPEVARVPRVGGLLDPNVEALLALKPDLVIVYNTQTELKQRLQRVGVPFYNYEHRALTDIMSTLRAVGSRIGSPGRAEMLAVDMERGIATTRASVSALPRLRTLLVFGREPSSLRNIDASGGYGFLHDMLEAAGGANVFSEIKKQSIQASAEMILSARPDVIIELRYGDSVKAAALPRELEVWNSLTSVPAVKNHRVCGLIGDEFVVPGPRVVDAVRRLARTLHPEAR